MKLTSIVRPAFVPRLHKIDRYDQHAEDIQRTVLRRLLTLAGHTEFAHRHSLTPENSYEQFAQQAPLGDYDSHKDDIDRMRHGAKDVLCRGEVKWYAKSSGTTSDKSKFIPVSPDGLKHLHYAGGTDVVALYLRNNPRSNLFGGKALILGGSHQPNCNVPGSLVGDLSAILIENISSFANHFRIPDKQTALLADFSQKRLRIAEMAARANVTNLSGVPSWMMSVLDAVLDLTGKSTIDQVWPELEVFFHGGVAFTPYRPQYQSLIANPDMHYMETYNASEGFFGIQSDPADSALLLMIDYDVFYEFIPVEEVGTPNPTILPLWAVETGRNYAMVITTSCGLWRYQIGDTVRFSQRNPYKFHITGRTKSFINAFGEELIVDNAEAALREACKNSDAIVREYTAAPLFMDQNAKCRHQWIIEFEQQPKNLEDFAQELDRQLQIVNSDYEAKRANNITLQRLELIPAPRGLFDDWLRRHGKLGGQHKVPRLANNRDIIDELLGML